jgi:hypothetical protein
MSHRAGCGGGSTIFLMPRHPATLLLVSCLCVFAQKPETLYDEAKVPQFALPDVLQNRDGVRVTDAKGWAKRRAEILALYEREVFGKAAAGSEKLRYEGGGVTKGVLGGKADRKLVTIPLGPGGTGPRMLLLEYLPAGAKGRVPMFLGMSFSGVHTVANDPGVPLGIEWVRGESRAATDASRGAAASQWQVEKILAAGCGIAVFNYNDVEPDFVGGMKSGVRQAYLKPGQTELDAGEWGAIAAWAWAASRAMDYLAQDPQVDAKHVALFGHSRLGKTALWAGALDQRFSVVIANESGEGGAAIARRLFGERTRDLNTTFPHWFDGNFKRYSGHEDQMPFESHWLLALVAPRGLYVASAEEDRWSDPKGEFLAAAGASAVWELLGKRGLGTGEMPGLHQPVGGNIRYHIRAGKHDVTAYDWEQYLKFARAEWGR